MKIDDVSVIAAGRWVFVVLYTNNGLEGVGEAGAFALNSAQASILHGLRTHLLGADPLRMDAHFQYLYQSSYFRGAALMGALSAIDIALWDIAGKHFGVPSGMLAGGRCRDKVRLYCHVNQKSLESTLEGIRAAAAEGFTAVGHLSPFATTDRSRSWFEPTAARLWDARARVAQYREAAGREVDLCIEVHRALHVSEAAELSRMIESSHPLFYEDPIPPDNIDLMAEVARRSPVPVATGERLHAIEEFQMLAHRHAAAFFRPDVCLCGGLTQTKKVAALAQASGIRVVPHVPRALSPVAIAASAQFASSTPNCDLLEYPNDPNDSNDTAKKMRTEFLAEGYQVRDGFIILPETPGLGVRLPENIHELPAEPWTFRTQRHVDGSTVVS